jgi:hypothetical protein
MEAFMKKIKLLAVGLVMLVALGMGFISCGEDEDDGPSVCEGTWRDAFGFETISFSGSDFTFLSDVGLSYKGTFTYTDGQAGMGNITLNFSQYSEDGTKWLNREKFIDVLAQKLAKANDSAWAAMREDAKTQYKTKATNEFAPPTTETGAYTLNEDTLTLSSASVSGIYYQGNAMTSPPGITPPTAKGLLIVYNRTTSAGNYIKKIEVTKDGVTNSETYGEEFSRNESRDIELDPGTYGLTITRGTDTTWERSSPITITANQITTVNFNIINSEEWPVE